MPSRPRTHAPMTAMTHASTRETNPETVSIGGDLPVQRIGYGAMRLAGPRAWGPSVDDATASGVLRRALALGVTLFDTADFYGPHVVNGRIAAALSPYPDGFVLSTKVGVRRGPDASWRPAARPEQVRANVEANLLRLKCSSLDLVHLRMGDGTVLPDSGVPMAESLGVLAELQAAGTVRHIGLSSVSVEQVVQARSIVRVASVQNLYNVADRRSQAVLDLCTREGIVFMAYFPLAMGRLATGDGPLAAIAERHGATPAQIALAWLLAVSPVVVPIPGTTSIAPLEENVAAAALPLDGDEVEALTRADLSGPSRPDQNTSARRDGETRSPRP